MARAAISSGSRMRRRQPSRARVPVSSVAEPREPLLRAVLGFVRSACRLPGITRIALLGSLTTSKLVPKDADLLVTVEPSMDLGPLAQAGRRLQGSAQSINLGADIFLTTKDGRYLGRICHWRSCHPRVACHAQHCGQRAHLNDDLHIVTLPADLIAAPPVELWPDLVLRRAVPEDVEKQLLAELAHDRNAPDILPVEDCPRSTH